jgi:HAE1 family hydrophobic/amphiphilic exporter-1
LEALEEQNIEAAPGKIGESSDKKAQTLQYTIKYTGKFNTKEQYENIPIKHTNSGRILKIKDIAEVEFGTTYFDVEAKLNGKPSAAIALKQLPGSNASEVIGSVKMKMEEMKANSFLPGMNYEVSYDVSRFLDASIHEVIKTLLEAFLLVSIVVFIFLQDWRSTIIPILAVPVSLIGTFFFIQFLGFSLNLITLFAMVLAIGIVVDDAIVVVEAVHAKMESSNIGAHRATSQAMKEISGAIIAITLVMSSVFLPTAFMGGPAGVFYKQFSLTMAISIFLSGIVALTLTPALCTIVLKKHQPNNNQPKALNTFFILFNKRYQNIENKYLKLLLKIVNRRMVTFTVLVLFTVSAGILGKLLPNGFIPNEDQGTFYASVTTPPGATLERTKSVINEIQKNTYGIDAIESVSTLSGTNILSDGTGATYGTALINLKPWAKRSQSVDDVIEALESRTRYIKDAKIEYFPPPAVPGYGNASGYELRLLDKTGSSNVKQMEDVVKLFIENLKKRKEIASAFTIFDASFPQYTLHIDNDKAAQKGITVNNAMSSLQTLLGSEYATNFIRFGQMYKVMVQALPQYRAFPDDILKLYVRNENNEMIPMSAFMSIEKTYGVDQTTRYNMFPSAEINGEGKASISSGTVLKAIQETAKQTLPNGYDIDWAGISRDEVNAGSEGLIIFAICLVFVYLVLAAQYESFLLPISVLLSLPIGVFGAFFMLWLLGLENNIYAQIAMIMLIGLLGKNAILIIEFATLKHREGKTAIEAAIEGAKARLRPILMTSFAFVAGLLPLMFASGAGAVGNKTIGTAAAGGMVFGTIFGVIIVPGLYVVFATLAEKFKGKRKEQKALTETL